MAMNRVNHHEKVTVESFLNAGAETLGMTLEAGRQGLHHPITEAAINRPGLALTGFFGHFAHRRIQVIGFAEHEYLSSLDNGARRERVELFLKHKVPCVIVTRQKKVFPEIQILADQMGVPVLRTHMITKHFINAATIIMENLMAPRQNVQGTMVEIMGIGVLIEGESGMGKSETALGLIEKGHALVSDDITSLRRDSAGSVIGSPVSVTRYHMEIRGLGIIHIPSLFGVASVREEKKLDLVATLCRPGPLVEADRDGKRRVRKLLGCEIPQVLIPVAPGRDVVNLIETASLDQKLKRLGHDAAKELDEKLISTLRGDRNVSE